MIFSFYIIHQAMVNCLIVNNIWLSIRIHYIQITLKYIILKYIISMFLMCAKCANVFSSFSLCYQLPVCFQSHAKRIERAGLMSKISQAFWVHLFSVLVLCTLYFSTKHLLFPKLFFFVSSRNWETFKLSSTTVLGIGRKPVIAFPLNGCSDIYSLLMSLLLIFFCFVVSCVA